MSSANASAESYVSPKQLNLDPAASGCRYTQSDRPHNGECGFGIMRIRGLVNRTSTSTTLPRARSKTCSQSLLEDRRGGEVWRCSVGQTEACWYLRVIYVPDPQLGSAFVITAYELGPKALKALRRRRRKKK
jgi:hypothetical protein